MANHKIAIEFVHLTTNGEKDIIHTYAYWDGRRSADSRNKAVIDAVAAALAPAPAAPSTYTPAATSTSTPADTPAARCSGQPTPSSAKAKEETPMQEHQEHEGFPFTLEVLQLTRNGEIVGRCFRITCDTCKQRNTKAVESLNSLVLQDAFEELCEEAKLHASSHDDTNYAE